MTQENELKKVKSNEEGSGSEEIGDLVLQEMESEEEANLLAKAEEDRADAEDNEIDEESKLSAEEKALRMQLISEASQKASAIVFRDTRIGKAYKEQFIPIVEAMCADNPGRSEAFEVAAQATLLITGILSEAGVDVSSREFTGQDAEALAPHVANRIQHNLKMLRPRGKESARIEYAEKLSEYSLTKALHLRSPNGEVNPTCYEFIEANEEFVTLRTNPKTATVFSFMSESGIDLKQKCKQSMIPDGLVIIGWDVIESSIVLHEKIELVNGFHPKYAKGKAGPKSQVSVDRITKKALDLNKAEDAIFNGITNAARENYQDALGLCEQFNIDVASLDAVMRNSGFALNKNEGRYLPPGEQTSPVTTNQETAGNFHYQNNPPQGGSSLAAEISSLADFLPRG